MTPSYAILIGLASAYLTHLVMTWWQTTHFGTRRAEYPINPLLLRRHSPRAMAGTVSPQELNRLFEAARWAQSSYNSQPWHFIYAFKGTAAWHPLFELLVPANQVWCKNASVLLVVASRKNFTFNEQPSVTHSFDTGAAVQNFALQASTMGLVVHPMSGFDYAKARSAVALPDGYAVEAMIAVGHPGRIKDLPEALQQAEALTGRERVSTFSHEGIFTKNR